MSAELSPADPDAPPAEARSPQRERQWQSPEWRDVDAEGGNLVYEDFLSFRLGRLYTLVQRETAAAYLEPAGLTLPEWRVLARLVGRSSIEMRELARSSLMDKAAISRAVDALLVKGLAARHTDPAHAKRRIVAITPAGRRLTRKLLPVAHRTQAAMLRLLAPDERAALGRAITRLTDGLSDRRAGQVAAGSTGTDDEH